MKYALKLNIIKRTNLIKKNIESETESRTENASGDGGWHAVLSMGNTRISEQQTGYQQAGEA